MVHFQVVAPPQIAVLCVLKSLLRVGVLSLWTSSYPEGKEDNEGQGAGKEHVFGRQEEGRAAPGRALLGRSRDSPGSWASSMGHPSGSPGGPSDDFYHLPTS